ncbi:MAG TPA: peptide ABC transporter ATP-binding protein [Terrisporobacter glycolicus]|uniref:ABC transporter ATP-binding protein n=1 Tax=Terrisporobacter TaxID=1505652 RepID=UPI000E8E185B|nr:MULTISPECIES: ABC transporter ATP-binding protein [Terrisporobacter]MBN9646995.1 ABC transporter ATP-binding protein [Terrisporobacter glycolicus]HBI92852.1 peptide ABC transporter ATP-binding protein [Terrisporobacter hibernicus]
MSNILEVKNLKTSFFTPKGEVEALRDVSFNIGRKEIVGLVGESGSGKSITSKSIMGLISHPGKVVGGEILFDGKDLVKVDEKEMRKIRGNEISMIFQDPMTALNPLIKVGKQISEVLMRHEKLRKKEAREKAIDLLAMVGIPSPEVRIDNYPHEFSGGMRQRVCIAMAMSSSPRLLIADEPTTALDVTIQAQILRLIKNLNKENENSTILITHDLGVVYNTCDKVIVMYGGQIMETGTVNEIFKNAKHPYTKGLLKSIPKGKTSEKERLVPIQGTPPNLFNMPRGCPFYDRCDEKKEACKKAVDTRVLSKTHEVKCVKVGEDK